MHRLEASLVIGFVAALCACSATPAMPVSASSGSAATPERAAESSPAGGPAAESRPASGPAAASSSAGGPAVNAGSPVAAGDSREDAHWIQADDYFVSQRAYERGWIPMRLGKMKQPPAAGGKGDALFFMIDDGSDQRSAHFYRTRPAVQADIVLGNLLVCFDNNVRDKIRGAPRNKDNARPGRWWLARITDLSDLPKGYATLSGSYHCAPEALRAVVQ